jgi:hypothetical protein
VDTRQILVAGNLCVGELADQVAGDHAAENPSGIRGRLTGQSPLAA